MDGQEEPLIGPAETGEDGLDSATTSSDTGTGTETEPAERPTVFVWLLTLSAGISGLLFGYDTGVISAALVSIGSSLSSRPLSAGDKSAIAAAVAFAALLASPCASVLADAVGRRRVVLLADVLFAAGAALQAASATVSAMVAGRLLVGAGVGAASFVVPLYVAELAPAAHRGRLVTINVLLVTLGQLLAYIVGWLLAEHGDPRTGWRWMVGLGAAPAVLQSALVIFIPESPRWLVRSGRTAEARAVMRKILGPASCRTAGDLADRTLKRIVREIRMEDDVRRAPGRNGAHADGKTGWLAPLRELLLTRSSRRGLAIACLLQGLQQLCGFNSLMYFSATIFAMVGFRSPTLTSLVVAATNFLCTVAALVVVDRVGRRRILLYTIPCMIAALLLCAVGFSMIQLPPPGAGEGATSPTPPTPPTPLTAPPPPPSSSGPPDRGAALLVLASIALYVAAYALGLGNVPWMQSELFALRTRSLGSGIATATNWTANLVVGLSFLGLMEAITPPWTFALYAAVCALGYGLVWRTYPEMAGLTLEEAALLLDGDGWGVRRSRQAAHQQPSTSRRGAQAACRVS